MALASCAHEVNDLYDMVGKILMSLRINRSTSWRYDYLVSLRQLDRLIIFIFL